LIIVVGKFKIKSPNAKIKTFVLKNVTHIEAQTDWTIFCTWILSLCCLWETMNSPQKYIIQTLSNIARYLDLLSHITCTVRVQVFLHKINIRAVRYTEDNPWLFYQRTPYAKHFFLLGPKIDFLQFYCAPHTSYFFSSNIILLCVVLFKCIKTRDIQACVENHRILHRLVYTKDVVL
jgi:hypothetical protein